MDCMFTNKRVVAPLVDGSIADLPEGLDSDSGSESDRESLTSHPACGSENDFEAPTNACMGLHIDLGCFNLLD